LETLVVVIHVLACVFLIVAVLLQSGQEGMGVIFGGGSGSVFGSTGAGGMLVKVTSVLAAVFLLTSLGYNLLISKRVSHVESIMLDSSGAVTAPTPAQEKKPEGVTFEDPKAAQQPEAPKQ